jgi:hypothetical protein
MIGYVAPRIETEACNERHMKTSKRERSEPAKVDDMALIFLKLVNAIMTRRLEVQLHPYPRVSGNMTFSLALRDLDVARNDLRALRDMLSVRFYADFIAEVILRRNVRQFMDRVAEQSGFELDVRLGAHQHFGVGFDDGRVFFIFHVSKLSEIANEEINEALKWRSKKPS